MKRYSLFASTQKQAHDIIEDPEGAWVKYEDVRDGFGEECDCCGLVGRDRRTLWMGCGYAMEELGIPFKQKEDGRVTGFNRGSLYTLRACKACRSRWLIAIKDWFYAKEADDDD